MDLLAIIIVLVIYIGYKLLIYKPQIDSTLPQADLQLFIFRTNKSAYLKSPQWRQTRLKILARDNFTCQSCSVTNTPLHVHHLSDYDKLGSESTDSLISLCQDCHTYQHDQLGYPQTYQEYMNWNVKLIKRT